jgi:hypothetical protein
LKLFCLFYDNGAGEMRNFRALENDMNRRMTLWTDSWIDFLICGSKENQWKRRALWIAFPALLWLLLDGQSVWGYAFSPAIGDTLAVIFRILYWLAAVFAVSALSVFLNCAAVSKKQWSSKKRIFLTISAALILARLADAAIAASVLFDGSVPFGTLFLQELLDAGRWIPLFSDRITVWREAGDAPLRFWLQPIAFFLLSCLTFLYYSLAIMTSVDFPEMLNIFYQRKYSTEQVIFSFSGNSVVFQGKQKGIYYAFDLNLFHPEGFTPVKDEKDRQDIREGLKAVLSDFTDVKWEMKPDELLKSRNGYTRTYSFNNYILGKFTYRQKDADQTLALIETCYTWRAALRGSFWAGLIACSLAAFFLVSRFSSYDVSSTDTGGFLVAIQFMILYPLLTSIHFHGYISVQEKETEPDNEEPYVVVDDSTFENQYPEIVEQIAHGRKADEIIVDVTKKEASQREYAIDAIAVGCGYVLFYFGFSILVQIGERSVFYLPYNLADFVVFVPAMAVYYAHTHDRPYRYYSDIFDYYLIPCLYGLLTVELLRMTPLFFAISVFAAAGLLCIAYFSEFSWIEEHRSTLVLCLLAAMFLGVGAITHDRAIYNAVFGRYVIQGMPDIIGVGWQISERPSVMSLIFQLFRFLN